MLVIKTIASSILQIIITLINIYFQINQLKVIILKIRLPSIISHNIQFTGNYYKVWTIYEQRTQYYVSNIICQRSLVRPDWTIQ